MDYPWLWQVAQESLSVHQALNVSLADDRECSVVEWAYDDRVVASKYHGDFVTFSGIAWSPADIVLARDEKSAILLQDYPQQ